MNVCIVYILHGKIAEHLIWSYFWQLSVLKAEISHAGY